jgi:hypothetical protein
MDKAIDSTIFRFKEIEHHKILVSYVNKDIALANYYMLFILAIESIQGKPTPMGV